MNENTHFDLIVIGGGPAGYVASIRAAQLGMRTACIDKRATWGGTCLNVGCIPSKALLDSSERYHAAQTQFKTHGIEIGSLQLNLAQMMKRKDSVVQQLVKGIDGLFKKNKVQGFHGIATLKPSAKKGEHTVTVQTDATVQTLTASRVLLATGSEPSSLPFLPIDGEQILSSTEILSLSTVPEHLIVVGGGVIGLEMGSVWLRLGAKVTIIEYHDRICPFLDQQIGQEFHRSLVQQGLQFQLNTRSTDLQRKSKKELILQAQNLKTSEKLELHGSHILVAAGRRPYSEGLGLEALSIQKDASGRVSVDEHYQTTAPGVYAVGDLITGPMLAHKAEEEGIAAVELMVGQAGHVNYHAIPNVIYTWPEIATVGFSEEELQTKGIPYQVGTFPFLANGRAKAMNEAAGLVKVISDKTTDRLLGVHILGPWASELIAEAVTVIEFGGSAEDLARTCHAHPTLSESVKEAALALDRRCIHF